MKHLRAVRMSYFTHLAHAWHNAGRLAVAALALAVHGVIPVMFTWTGSEIVKRTHRSLAGPLEETHSPCQRG